MRHRPTHEREDGVAQDAPVGCLVLIGLALLAVLGLAALRFLGAE